MLIKGSNTSLTSMHDRSKDDEACTAQIELLKLRAEIENNARASTWEHRGATSLANTPREALAQSDVDLRTQSQPTQPTQAAVLTQRSYTKGLF
jgi:hypothetical protein